MIIVLTGRTASGKTTLEAELQRKGMSRAISHTTRPMREGEINGREYYFVDKERYDFMKYNREFVETVEFSSAKYGMSVEALNDAMSRGNVVIVAEPDGARQLRRYCRSNDIAFAQIWVACATEVRVERWFERVITDMKANNASLASYKARLAAMLDNESTWDVDHTFEATVSTTNMSPDDLADKIIRRFI